MSKVTHSELSDNGFGFKVYDTAKKEVISYIHRKDSGAFSQFIHDVLPDAKDPDRLLFVFNEIQRYNICSINMIGVFSTGDKGADFDEDQ